MNSCSHNIDNSVVLDNRHFTDILSLATHIRVEVPHLRLSAGFKLNEAEMSTALI